MKKTVKILLLLIGILSFNLLTADDYYWVGGQGAWSDVNSWRLTSGDIPGEVPDANDNVIFNENSFINKYDTVFILTGNPTCKNMTWENIPDTVCIVGGSVTTTFSIHGSVTFHKYVLNDYRGKIFFQSDIPGNTITCNGARFAGDIWFNGGGDYTLQDTLYVLDTVVSLWKYVVYYQDSLIEPLASNPIIIQNNGSLNTNQQVVISRGFQTNGGSPRILNIDKSKFYIVGNWTLNGEDLTFTADSSYIRMLGEMNNLSGDEVEYFDIDFLPLSSSITNTNIKSIHRKIHFLGSGTVEGSKTPGIEGSFTIDTLLFEGAISMMGPIPCEVRGIDLYIWYTRVNTVHGVFTPDRPKRK